MKTLKALSTLFINMLRKHKETTVIVAIGLILITMTGVGAFTSNEPHQIYAQVGEDLYSCYLVDNKVVRKDLVSIMKKEPSFIHQYESMLKRERNTYGNSTPALGLRTMVSSETITFEFYPQGFEQGAYKYTAPLYEFYIDGKKCALFRPIELDY